jgi:hypothetical protein
MFDGRGKLAPLDNDRYEQLRFTPVRAVLEAKRLATVTARHLAPAA